MGEKEKLTIQSYEVRERFAGTPLPLFQAWDHGAGVEITLCLTRIAALRHPQAADAYLALLDRWQAWQTPARWPVLAAGVEEGVLSAAMPRFAPDDLASARTVENPETTLCQVADALNGLHGQEIAHGGISLHSLLLHQQHLALLPPVWDDTFGGDPDAGPDYGADLKAFGLLIEQWMPVRTAKWERLRRRLAGCDPKEWRRHAQAIRWTVHRPEGWKPLAELLTDSPLDPDEGALILQAVLRRMGEAHSRGAEPAIAPEAISWGPGGVALVEDLEPASGGLNEAKSACPDLFHLPAAEQDPQKINLYRLGFLFYELLLGRELFGREFPQERSEGDAFWYGWHADRAKRARRLDEVIGDFPTGLASLLAALGDKDPASRPASIEAASRRIELMLRPDEEPAESVGSGLWARWQRRPAKLLLAERSAR
jgi:hypothetical protein